jgi:hypothetical protein
MKIVELTPSLLKDFLSRPLRPEDVQEWADGGMDVYKAMAKNIKPAQYKRCVVIDQPKVPETLSPELAHEEQVVAVWACRVDEGIGTLTLVGADRPELVVPIHQEFSRSEWPEIKKLAPVLQAYPSLENFQHHRWLKHFGFREVGAPMKIGNGHFQRWVWTEAEG